MEILSDATFKGDVTFNKQVTINNSEIITGSLITKFSTIEGKFGVDGNFSFAPINEPCSPILEISSYKNHCGVRYNSISIGSDVYVAGGSLYVSGTGSTIEKLNATEINISSGVGRITLGNVSISSWDELKGCQCRILRFRSPTIPASCNTFYFINPDGSNAIIPVNPGVAGDGSVSEFFITQVYSANGDNWGRVVQMETGLKWCRDNNTFALYGSIANHNEEIPETSYIAVVNI